MQDDKATTFAAIDDLALALAAMTGMVDDLQVNEAAMRAAAMRGYSTATDLADYLVRRLGMPFRDAHHATGAIVALAEKKGLALDELAIADFRSVEPRIGDDVLAHVTVDASVAARASYGGTAPCNVKAEAARWKERLS
jgi:argininosuccinate lyase